MSKDKIFILLGIIVMGACLRFYGLDRQPLWFDEVFETTSFQRQFLHDRTMITPSTPPLNSFFVYPITRIFPDNDLALRMIPFTFGVISIPLLFLLGRRVINERAGLIASYLLAISPFHIWYSQEVRMYALQWMLALISLIFFFRALQERNYINYIGYIVSTVLGLYTLQLAIFLLVIQGVYLLLFFRHHRARLSVWIFVFTMVVLLYSPWIIYQLLYLTDRGTSFPKETNLLTFIPYTFFSYFAGYSIGPSLRELHLNPSIKTIKPYIPIITLLMLLYSLIFLYGISRLTKDVPKLIFILLLSTVPIVGLLTLIKVVPKMSYNVRYTGIALFGFILGISEGIESLIQKKEGKHNKLIAMTILCMMTGLSGYSYWNYQFNPEYHKEDVRTAASYIEENREEGDEILVITSTCAITLNRYLDKDHRSIGYPPLDTNNRDEVIRKLRRIIEGKKRLWLVLCREWYEKNLTNYTKQWLDTNYREIKELHRDTDEIANLQIFCYDLTREKKTQE
jgi:4-amino-4-deoxy-L-arabinose transferase-like glycosyltransferase